MVADKGSSESATLIFGQLLACAGSGINKVTADFGAGINGVVCPWKEWGDSDIFYRTENSATCE